MIDLSIVIVSYNTREILRDCLRSVFEHPAKKYATEVIIVDNVSKDDSYQMVRNAFPEVLLIANDKNEGFSKANNIGVAKSKGRYLLFLNSDTLLHEGTLDTMLFFMESQKDAGAATCYVKLPGGDLDDASHRGFPTPWRAFSHFSGIAKLLPWSKWFGGYQLGWERLDMVHEIDACAGAFMLVRREAGDLVGWWDEDYFWYGEDIDFCYRLKQKRWNIYFVPNASILHYKGVSGGIKKGSKHLSSADDATKKKATKARLEAMRIFYRKHYVKKYPGIVTWLVEKGILLKERLSGV